MINEFLKVTFTADLKQFNAGLKNVSNRLGEVGKNMESFGRNLAVKVTAPIAAFSAVSVKAFAEQEKAELKLRAALEANGREVDKLFQEYKDFASQLQSVTIVGDEATLAMLQMAENMGLTGENAKRAAQNAIGLSSAFGISAQSAMRYTAMLEQGDTTMLNRYIPTLRAVEDETERVALAQDILSKAFETSRAEARTLSGQIQQIRNNFGDFQEVVGGIIAEALEPFTRRIKFMVMQLKSMNPQVIKTRLAFAGIAAAIPIVILAVSKLILGLKGLATMLGVILSPIALKVAALAMLAAGIKYAADNSEQLAQRFEYYFALAQNAVVDMVVESLLALQKLAGIVPGMETAFISLAAGMASMKADVPDKSDFTPFGSFADSIGGAVDFIQGKMKDLVQSFGFEMPNLAMQTTIKRADMPDEGESVEERMIQRFENVAEKSKVKVKEVNNEVKKTVDVLGDWGNMLTNLFDTLVFETSRFGDVLKMVLRQLASKAFLT
ncbi:MAG: hypothetical protein EBR93_01260, partial [Bacteroidetes bacterium]|nr:hypothetical protein [Bacteroidota bacterium]